MQTPVAGELLVSEPYLGDPNFDRTVVLIVNSKNGHLGFVLNRISDVTLGEVLDIQNGDEVPIYIGGPVAPDTLHFLHCRPDLVEEGEKVTEDVYWGGNFEQLKGVIENGLFNPTEFRFFIGYSGWSPHQLYGELKHESWFTTSSDRDLIFETEPEELWEEVLRRMGGKYSILVNSPEDPQWN